MSGSGFVNIIKPTGMTSFAVVSKVKKILNTKKVGHLGTLDPAASGVLPIAVGKATRFFDYFLNKDKVYVARVLFGIETDTLDSFGKVTAKQDKKVLLKDIKSVLEGFTGEIEQIPPKYSAIKVDGKRAYDLARENRDFELKPRKVQVFSIDVHSTSTKNEFLFKVHCSAGTYIRTLMADIAHEIGSVATTFAIIRTKSGIFDINGAITLEEFEDNRQLLKIEDAFLSKKFIEVDENIFKKLVCGIKVSSNELGDLIQDNDEFFVKHNDEVVGLYNEYQGKVCCKIFLYEKS